MNFASSDLRVKPLRTLPRALPLAALFLVPPCLIATSAQAATSRPVATANTASATQPDRSSAYYHYALAHLYEDLAVNAGRSDYATQAIEEYKLALNADPTSLFLQDGLADLYFKVGRIREAVSAAQEQINRNPNDFAAHALLGKVYLRSLGDMQGQQSAQMLQLAITEYEKLVELKPADIENHLLLGQLYSFNHDSAKAEAQFQAAQKIDSSSEEVVLNIARLYSEQGDLARAAQALAAVPETDRTARMELALAGTYDQLHKNKEAIAAYRRAIELDGDDLDASRGLAAALLNDNQLDESLKVYTSIVAQEPQDAQSQIHIAEIQRRQGHYEAALETIRKARPLAQDSVELIYNEALTDDALGRYDDSAAILLKLVQDSTHPDGKYTEQEKSNRGIFLDRLGNVYREQNKTAEAVATYRLLLDLGGDYTRSGYQGMVDAYRDNHQWAEATNIAAEAAQALAKDHSIQLMYAGQLADTGKLEQGLALARAQLAPAPGVPEDRDVYLALAQIYTRVKQFPQAAEQLDKAATLSLQPDQTLYVEFLRGALYDREKLYVQAEAEFRKALTIDPQNATVLNYLGYMFADRGVNLPEALSLVQKAVELDPQNGAYLDSLGWVYFKSGQYALAEESLRKALDRISSDPTIHDHLGEVYAKTGRLKLAVTQWQRSLDEYAHSLPADADPEDVAKVQHKLDTARVKLAVVKSEPAKADPAKAGHNQ
ncbi:MAG: tetratricopeptide repeat protein [Acidobacteriota bacterium]|nr:tetratricopeptide repeat protein [Acidobacteriota bacterium]